MTVTGSIPTHTPPVRRSEGRDSFLLPDGSRVTINAPGLDTSGRWNCLFVAHIAGKREGFTVAPRQGDRAVPEEFGDVTVHPYRGAELLLAYDFRERAMMASWRGRWHELINSRTSGQVGPEPFLPIFGAFQITDTPEGLLAKPGRRVSLESLRVFKSIPGIGDLHIQRPHQADTAAPGWRGAQARHGEMWRAKVRDDGADKRAREDALILGTPTALTELIANPGDTADDDEAVAFLSDLNVTWSES